MAAVRASLSACAAWGGDTNSFLGGWSRWQMDLPRLERLVCRGQLAAHVRLRTGGPSCQWHSPLTLVNAVEICFRANYLCMYGEEMSGVRKPCLRLEKPAAMLRTKRGFAREKRERGSRTPKQNFRAPKGKAYRFWWRSRLGCAESALSMRPTGRP